LKSPHVSLAVLQSLHFQHVRELESWRNRGDGGHKAIVKFCLWQICISGILGDWKFRKVKINPMARHFLSRHREVIFPCPVCFYFAVSYDRDIPEVAFVRMPWYL
jgi:hypothetical protein